MDPENDDEMNTRLGEIMGFTNFGMNKPDFKKRKTSHDNNPVTATSSNAIPLGNQNSLYAQPLTHNPNPAHTSNQVPHVATSGVAAAAVGASSASPSTEQPKNAFPTGVPMEIFDKLTWKELEAYRKGVKKDNGDLAWFLPSFIEDPWAKLEKSAGGNGAGPS
jgi:hypothetical protein